MERMFESRNLKGFGFLFLTIIFAAFMMSQLNNEAAEMNEFHSYLAIQERLDQLGTLRMVLQSSYSKTDRYHLDAWRIAVIGPLAEEYDVQIVIEQNHVVVIDPDLRLTSEFDLV